MGYCKKSILRTALLRNILPFLVFAWCLFMGINWQTTKETWNDHYVKQAQELNWDKPAIIITSDKPAIYFYLGAGFFGCILCYQFSPYFYMQRSKLGKSVQRYEKYQGEGNLPGLIQAVDRDVQHAPAFGSIIIGEEWIVGRCGRTVNGALFRDDVCAMFYYFVAKRSLGKNNILISTKEYALVFIDKLYRDTIFVSAWEKDIMGAYRMLCRHHDTWIHGDFDDYTAFCSLSAEERERALHAVQAANYNKKYKISI